MNFRWKRIGTHTQSTPDPSESARLKCRLCGVESDWEGGFVAEESIVHRRSHVCITCFQFRKKFRSYYWSWIWWGSFALLLGYLLGESPGTAVLLAVAWYGLCYLFVVLHELGHFLAAAAVGVRVAALSFGGGPALFLVLALACSTAPLAADSPDTAPKAEAPAASCLTPNAVTERVAFATLAESRTILSRPDNWARQLSAFDRGVRQRTLERTSTNGFLEFLAGAAAAWNPPEKARWQSLVDRLSGTMAGLNLALPEVFMVKTTGEEEFYAAYSRNDSIMLPEGRVEVSREDARQDFFLLAHEMFHLISGENLRERESLYALLGFERVGNFVWPAELEERRLSNPDSGSHSHQYALTVRTAAGFADVVPVIQSTVPLETAIDLSTERPIFEVIEMVLLPVETGTGEVLRDRNGSLVTYGLDETDWVSLMQRNSTYIIHPDELLADNFALLMEWRSTGVMPTATPGGFPVNDIELLRTMEKVLTARCGDQESASMASRAALRAAPR